MSYGLHIKKNYFNINHENLTESIISETQDYGIDCVQIFTHGPRNFSRVNLDIDILKKTSLKIYSHSPYPAISSLNIADYEKMQKKHIDLYKNYVDLTNDIPQFKGFVVHLPKNTPTNITRSINELKNIFTNKNNPIILEMRAMKIRNGYSYILTDELNELSDSLKKTYCEWGLCIDTAHLWAGGIDVAKKWDKWYNKLTPYTKSKIRLFHLNGALSKLYETGKDKHIIPFSKEDGIWGDIIPESMRDAFSDGIEDVKFIATETRQVMEKLLKQKKYKQVVKNVRESSFINIINISKENDIDVIFEINEGEYIDTLFLINLVNVITS